MDEIEGWEQLVEALAKTEWTPSQQVEGGTIYKAAKPIEKVLGDSDWYRSNWYREEEVDRIERHTLLAMNWDFYGAPNSWDGFLEMLQVGDEVAYVLLWLEGITDTPEILGKVVPSQTPAAYRSLFLELMRDGETFLTIPDHTYNGRPDLLDGATVRQGFWEVMQRADAQDGTAWDELRRRVDEPPPGLVSVSSQAKVQEPEKASPPLSEAERQALLDRSFAKNYEEAGDV